MSTDVAAAVNTRKAASRVHANTSGRVFEHMHAECMEDNPTLNAAASFWMNSLRIRTETLDVCENLTESTTPLGVDLVLNVSGLQKSTTGTLSIQVSDTCTKTFQFLSAAQVRIPVSSSRPTALSVRLQHADGSLGALRNSLVDGQTQTEFRNIQLQPTQHTCVVYSCLDTINWKFPCYQYKRDAHQPTEDYDMQKLGRDLAQLNRQGQLLPSYNKLIIVSSAEATQLVQKLHNTWREIENALQDCRRSTLKAELGVTDADANALMKSVDWDASYCVPSDTHVGEIMTLARELYYRLQRTTQVAVNCSWLFSTGADLRTLNTLVRDAVCDLMRIRSSMVQRVALRRQDLPSVVRVRTSFLCISAIDAAARSVCGMTSSCKDGSFKADDVACHAYWLGQMKSNTSNSVTMSESIYTQATQVLQKCQRVQNSGVVLLPPSPCALAPLAQNAWQNMHLQGLACRDAFVVASAPHFLYKQKQVMDYSKHPMLSAFKEHVPGATAQQVESAKLFAVLVSADVEHRIITQQTGRYIEQQWKVACDNSSTAREGLCALFEPSVASLIASAFDPSVTADVSFITDPRSPTTGYDAKQLAALELQHLRDAVMRK